MKVKLNKKQQEELIEQHSLEILKRLGLYSDEGEEVSETFYEMDRKREKIFEKMQADLSQADKDNKPSVILQEKYQNILDAYVEKDKQKELLYIIDKHCRFTYSVGHHRRSVRTQKHWYIDNHTLSGIFKSYYNLSFYGKDMVEYLNSQPYRSALDELVGSYRCPDIREAGSLIAAELDMGNTNLAETLEAILMSENNTNIVTVEIIEGIVKSDNTHLHKVLGDFLLAARLQEGVRQAVCEAMDQGTIEAFLTLFRVIYENDLIRFSAVKRAVCVWTGICDEEHMERITGKQLEIMNNALQDENYLQEILQSNDNIELYIGLWVQGFYEVEDAIESCNRLIEQGTKNQKLLVSYYNLALQESKFTSKVANQVIETYPDDLELCAAFHPTYMPNISYIAFEAIYGKIDPYNYTEKREYLYRPVSYEMFFEGEAQARKHFELLKQIRLAIPKKGHSFSPCIFPWYSVEIYPSFGIEEMAMIAYMMQDNDLIDEACVLLPELKNIYERRQHLRLLLHEPKTPTQRQTLLQALTDKSPDVRREAYEMVCELELVTEDYDKIRGFLKYKASDIRENTLALLEKQKDEELKCTITDILKDKKEEVRLGGLDLVMRLKKDEKRQKLYEECVTFLGGMEKVSEKESVIITELTGKSTADSVLNERGYGLYNPDAAMTLPKCQADPQMISNLMSKSEDELHQLMKQLDAIYAANADREYKNSIGYELLLGNLFVWDYNKKGETIDKCPFPELWRGFYEEHVKDFETLVNLHIFCLSAFDIQDICRTREFQEILQKIFGREYLRVDITEYQYGRFIKDIIGYLYEAYAKEEKNRKLLQEAGYSIIAACLELPKEMGQILEDTAREKDVQETVYVTDCSCIKELLISAKDWKNNDEFDKMFLMCQQLNEYYGANATDLYFLHYVKAYTRNLISLDNVYQAAFEIVGLRDSLVELAPIVNERKSVKRIQCYLQTDGDMNESPVFDAALDIYWKLTEMILKVELKRSEVPTSFSTAINRISKVRGIAHLLDILTALGKDTLERSVYYNYYYNATDKKTCLCHLLYVSEPLPDENGETLKKLMGKRKISEKRLVEVAMYNPKWIDCIEEYLGWSGLKSGIYYFTAHMNEEFSERTEAMIAKYTPLTKEELNDGAFDLAWFEECSNQLGEKRFQMLYDSAKYISESNKHTRARKYADAAQGKVTVEELEAAITDKRNKDLLMSYPLVPLKDESDVLHRYQFMQKFLKESRQFGAQRRASESKAVAMGLQNLAASSGYADVTRLTLNMETKLVEEMQAYFQWQQVEDVKIKIAIGEDGKPAIICEADGKSRKIIPAKYKKNEVVVNIKEVCAQLKDQYTRTKAMMEQFMEDGVEFLASELAKLMKNPVILPILKDLVYITDDTTGFVQSLETPEAKQRGIGMTDYTGAIWELQPEQTLRIAHPFDLWKLKIWQEYQKLLFENKVKQPFKQVFRELYVKTEEELEKYNSMRYAGNQIQPGKTVACLKGRRWVADYEDGLQKIYYKENIVARIYALADWFSPSDVEAPTLEWVEFSNRKTFEPIAIKDVPDYIFSEVMRDVDLAVSVAHAGGVDPETSHSTMEMRKAIVEFNLPLFGLTNVTFAGNHAVIEGKRANYTVHLGSGVVFKRGGTQIAVLPVHSQHRGKLFLPFIDEDPKTAEIMSKIVLFAEDMKIKDPYILQQITCC